MVENAIKARMWMQIFLSVFENMKTEVLGNALVWTRPKDTLQLQMKQNVKKMTSEKIRLYCVG